DVLQGKPARSAVNLPALSPDEMARVAPYLVLARQIGSLHTQLARENTGAGRPIDAVEVVFSGDFTGLPTETITRAVLQGLMTPILSDPVNLVNAPVLAEARGIKVTESHSRTSPEHTCPAASAPSAARSTARTRASSTLTATMWTSRRAAT